MMLIKLMRMFVFPVYCAVNNFSIRYVFPDFINIYVEKFRVFVIRLMGASIGRNTYIRTEFFTVNFSNINIGANCTIGIRTQFYSYDTISIGNNCLLGSGLIIHTSEHNFENIDKPISEQGACYKKVKVGNNVYIGSNVVILPGVEISDNVIIGAGSIVTKSLKSGFIYGGVPARELREWKKA